MESPSPLTRTPCGPSHAQRWQRCPTASSALRSQGLFPGAIHAQFRRMSITSANRPPECIPAALSVDAT
eukprot:scaffold8008_cov34-Tisochrysis_lutea.AAC.3